MIESNNAIMKEIFKNEGRGWAKGKDKIQNYFITECTFLNLKSYHN